MSLSLFYQRHPVEGLDSLPDPMYGGGMANDYEEIIFPTTNPFTDIELVDEALTRDEDTGEWVGWSMFVEIQGHSFTFTELRDLADIMEAKAKESLNTDRTDI